MTFYIAPRPPRIKKAVSDSRKKVSLRWSKKKQADGYQIKIARDKQFTRKVKTVNIKKNTKVKKTVKRCTVIPPSSLLNQNNMPISNTRKVVPIPRM